MDLFRKKKEATVCKICNLDCFLPDRLEKHMSIAHKQHDTSRESRRAIQKGKQFSF